MCISEPPKVLVSYMICLACVLSPSTHLMRDIDLRTCQHQMRQDPGWVTRVSPCVDPSGLDPSPGTAKLGAILLTFAGEKRILLACVLSPRTHWMCDIDWRICAQGHLSHKKQRPSRTLP